MPHKYSQIMSFLHGFQTKVPPAGHDMKAHESPFVPPKCYKHAVSHVSATTDDRQDNGVVNVHPIAIKTWSNLGVKSTKRIDAEISVRACHLRNNFTSHLTIVYD